MKIVFCSHCVEKCPILLIYYIKKYSVCKLQNHIYLIYRRLQDLTDAGRSPFKYVCTSRIEDHVLSDGQTTSIRLVTYSCLHFIAPRPSYSIQMVYLLICIAKTKLKSLWWLESKWTVIVFDPSVYLDSCLNLCCQGQGHCTHIANKMAIK